MSTLLELQSITLSYAKLVILKDINLQVTSSTRCGLVGNNGTGKSTLLNLLEGKHPPQEGKVRRAPGLRVSLVSSRDANTFDGQSVYEVAAQSLENVRGLERQLHGAEKDLAANRLSLDDYAAFVERFEAAGGYGAEAKLQQRLAKLGLKRRLAEPAAGLSPTTALRLRLATALSAAPDLLLLDEPTLGLDMRSKESLALLLAAFKGALITASHDRAFLDRVATSVWALENHRVSSYKGNYSAYAKQREQQRRQNQRAARVRHKEASALQAQLRVQRNPVVRQRLQQQLEALTRAPEAAVQHPKRVALHGQLRKLSAQQTVIHAKNILTGAFTAAQLRVFAGDKIALLGEAGSGKSLLLSTLALETPLANPESALFIAANVKMLYLDELSYGFKDDLTLAEQLAAYVSSARARGLLALVGLGDKADAYPAELSHGQRARAAVALLYAAEANVLLIDNLSEPLDLNMLTHLEELLGSSPATIIMVSQDAALVDRICNRFWVLENGSLQEYRGGTKGVLKGTLRQEAKLDDLLQQPEEAAHENSEDSETSLEALEDALLDIEARCADPLRLSERELCRLKAQHKELLSLLCEAYDARLQAAAPRYRAIEAGLQLESDGLAEHEHITLKAEGGYRLILTKDPLTRIGHLQISHPPNLCLLPWAELALIRAATRLAFEAFAVQVLQMQREASLKPAGFRPAGANWWLQDADHYAAQAGYLRAPTTKKRRRQKKRGWKLA